MDVELTAEPLPHLLSRDNLFQSGFWGRFKARFAWTPFGFRLICPHGRARLLVLCREVGPGRAIAYVPLGPDLAVPPAEQGPLLEALSLALRPNLPEGCVYVRYDLPWNSPYARQEGDSIEDPRPAPRIRELRMNFGTAEWKLRKAPTDLLPPDTVVIDLEADEELLLARMSSTARYNVRVSRRRGVSVERASPGELSTWYGMYAATTRRHGIECHDESYFRALWETAGHGRGCRTRLVLLLARVGARPAAGMILALRGARAVYLFGASAPGHSRLAPSHGLQWEAMMLARAEGCTSYDLFGIPPSGNPAHPMHGLYRFKTGFGGTIVRRRGCWDYSFDDSTYTRIRGLELGRESFHRPRSGAAPR